MSQEITPRTPQGLAEKKGWADTLAASNLLPPAYQKQPANLFLAAEYADTLGIPRIAAVTGIHVIQGKPSMSADLMAAQVRRAGHKLRVKASDTEAVAQLIRKDDPDFTYECRWTLERAKQAGLLGKRGGNWQAYPAAMLKARAISEVIREGCSEVLYGAVYTPEELGAVVDAEGGVVASESVPVPSAPAPSVDRQPHVPCGAFNAVAEYRATQPAAVEVVEEIRAHAAELHLDRDTLEKTLRYVTQDQAGLSLDDLTAEAGEALVVYLRQRVEQARADATNEPVEEVLEGIIEDGDV